jgi:quinol-cytochrome oxidoreductase complex cytochrome b subunit
MQSEVTPKREGREDLVATALRWTLVIGAVAFVVLLVTGLYLIWNYRPSASLPFGRADPPADSLPDTMRDIHRWSASVLTFATIAVAILTIGSGWSRRRLGPAVTGIAVLLVTLGATVTGSLLPWEQVALRAVTVGTEYRGFTAIHFPDVRYVLLQGSEIATADFAAWFRVHAIVIPVVLIGLAVVLARSTRLKGGL